MTERLYYTDSYVTEFDARVEEVVEFDGRPALILDRTHFYPTSGGQSHDIGSTQRLPGCRCRGPERLSSACH